MASNNPMVPVPKTPASSEEEARYRGVALQQLAILRRQLQLGGLAHGKRSVDVGNGVKIEVSINFNDERAYVRVPARGGQPEVLTEIPVLLPVDFKLEQHSGLTPYLPRYGTWYLVSGGSRIDMCPVTLYAPTDYGESAGQQLHYCMPRDIKGKAYPAGWHPGPIGSSQWLSAPQPIPWSNQATGDAVVWPLVKAGGVWRKVVSPLDQDPFEAMIYAPMWVTRSTELDGSVKLWLNYIGYDLQIAATPTTGYDIVTRTMTYAVLRAEMTVDGNGLTLGAKTVIASGSKTWPPDSYPYTNDPTFHFKAVSEDLTRLVGLSYSVSSHRTDNLIEATISGDTITFQLTPPETVDNGTGLPNKYWVAAWYDGNTLRTVTYEVTSSYVTENVNTFDHATGYPVSAGIGYSSLDSQSKAELVIGDRRMLCHFKRHRVRSWGSGSSPPFEEGDTYTYRTEHGYSSYSAVLRGYDLRSGVLAYYEQALADDFESPVESRLYSSSDTSSWEKDATLLWVPQDGTSVGLDTPSVRLSNRLEYFNPNGGVVSSEVFGSRLYDANWQNNYAPMGVLEDGFTLPSAAQAEDDGAFVSMFVVDGRVDIASYYWIPFFWPTGILSGTNDIILVPPLFSAQTTIEGHKFVYFAGDSTPDAGGWLSQVYVRNDALGEDATYYGSGIQASPTYQLFGYGVAGGTREAFGEIAPFVTDVENTAVYNPATGTSTRKVQDVITLCSPVFPATGSVEIVSIEVRGVVYLYADVAVQISRNGVYLVTDGVAPLTLGAKFKVTYQFTPALFAPLAALQ